jgi:hypothetical protein
MDITFKDGLYQVQSYSNFNKVPPTVSSSFLFFPSIRDIYKSVAAKREAHIILIV